MLQTKDSKAIKLFSSMNSIILNFLNDDLQDLDSVKSLYTESRLVIGKLYSVLTIKPYKWLSLQFRYSN